MADFHAPQSASHEAPNTTGEVSANWNALPVDLDAVVRQELDAAQRRGQPLKAIADEAGIPGWRLYEIGAQKKKLAFADASRFMRSIRSTGLLEALARSVGAIVFFVRGAHAGNEDLYQAFEDAVQDLAAIAREKNAALADGRIDEEESARI